MSTVLIVGGDHIDGIKKTLASLGVQNTNHWSGRTSGDHHKTIPKDTRFIVLITTFISHSLTKQIKRAAAKRHLPIVYTTSDHQALETKMHSLQQQANTLLLESCRQTHQSIQHLTHFMMQKSWCKK